MSDNFDFYEVVALPPDVKLPKGWYVQVRYCTLVALGQDPLEQPGVQRVQERYSDGSASGVYRTKLPIQSVTNGDREARHCLSVNLATPRGGTYLVAAFNLETAYGVGLADPIDCKCAFAALSQSSLKGFLGTCAVVGDNDPYEVDTIQAVFEHVGRGGVFERVCQKLWVKSSPGRL